MGGMSGKGMELAVAGSFVIAASWGSGMGGRLGRVLLSRLGQRVKGMLAKVGRGLVSGGV